MQFTNTVVRGGVEEHILVLLRGLNRDEFKLSLVCPPVLAKQYQGDVPSDIEVIELAPFRLRDFRAMRAFRKLLRDLDVDLLHAHMFQSSRISAPLAKLAGIKTIETCHVRESWRTSWPKSSYLPDRIVSRFIDRYIAISYANARYLSTEKKISSDKVTVVQNSCNMQRFLAAPEPAPNLREELGIGKEDPFVLAVARLEPQKGHEVLLEATKLLIGRWPTLRVVCIGDGVLKEQLQEKVKRLGLTDSILLLGFRPNVPQYLREADFCVLPSLYEGLPLVAIECLAANRTMVATAVDGTPEVIKHEETGLLVPSQNPSALAAAIDRLLADRSLRDRLAESGNRFVSEQFREERQVRETESVYLDLCGRAAIRDGKPELQRTSTTAVVSL